MPGPLVTETYSALASFVSFLGPCHPVRLLIRGVASGGEACYFNLTSSGPKDRPEVVGKHRQGLHCRVQGRGSWAGPGPSALIGCLG
nr:hypothetical protein BaRGS_003737 [Batillaria attramentaria]